MEYENKYGSRGATGAALGLGIAGTALGVMNNGGLGLGNLFGGCNNRNNGYDPIAMYALLGNRTACSEDHCVNRYEAGLQAKISDLESGIALRDANTYNDQKLLEMYKYFDGKIGHIEREICDQKVFNATQTAAMNCMGGQIAQLYSLTKLVVPNASVCPGWGNVTITPATAPTTAG